MRFRFPPLTAMLPGLGMGLWLGLAPLPAPATTQAVLLAEGLDAADAGNWVEAKQFGQRAESHVASDILLWIRLRDGAGNWDEYGAFLAAHPDWPGLAALRRAAERQMPSGMPPEQVFAFFGGEAPQTGIGSLRLAAAYDTAGRRAEAEAEAVRAWTTFSMSQAERNAFMGRWKPVLAGHHEARLDMLLWRGQTGEAEAMLGLVDPDWQRLAQARIACRRDAEGLQYAISVVPPSLRGDPGLAYERYLYRVTKGRWQDAEAFILERSTSAKALGRPDFWMERRANLARQALEDGDVAGAYRIAARNFGTAGPDYADAEWVAGFIALTRMNKPQLAVEHFQRFQAAVATPISLGRAGYWLGLAHEHAGDSIAARAAFEEGARYQTSFYGQLAAAKLPTPPQPALDPGPAVPDWRDEAFMKSSVVQAAYLLSLAGDDRRASQFFRHAAGSLPPPDRAALAQMAIDIGRPHVGIRIAKDAAAAGVILPEQYYPLHPIAAETWPVATEYAMAIARQESELNPRAASEVGARGLMQLMPATAERTAERVGLPYDIGRLGTDPLYNARLGTSYLAQMLAYYDGSTILATAAYNAGPGRVDKWVETFGDPRDGRDPVTWIESIPYEETRNYVMRVLEGMEVYRHRLPAPQPVEVAEGAGTSG